MTVPVGSLAAYLSVPGAAQARRDILAVQESLAATGETATRAGVGLSQSEAAIAGVGRSSGTASVSANKLRVAQLGVVAATERYNAVLADENASVAQLARAEATLIRSTERVASITRINAAAQTQATEATYAGAAAISESSAASSRFAQASGGTVKQLGLLFGGFELLKAGIDIGKEANTFQASMVRIRALTGAGKDAIDGMSTALLNLSGKVGTAPDELATSLYHMVAVGLPAKEALNAVEVAAKGAIIGNADLEQTTNALTSTIATGIVKTQSFADTMSQLLTIVGSGDMSMEQLNEALGTGLLAKMKGYGLDLKDVGAALAAFGDLNIRGADGATMLRMAVESFAKPAAGGIKALAGIGLQADSLRKDMQEGGLNKAVTDLNDHLKTAGVTGDHVGGVLLDIFSKKGAAGVSQMVQAFERIQSKYKDLGIGAQTLSQRWEETSATGSFAFKQLGAEAQAEGIKIFRNLTPAATSVAQAIGVLLPAAIHTAADALTPFVAAWHGLEAVLTPVGSALHEVGSFLEPIAPAASGVGMAVLTMWATFKGYQVARAAVFAIQDMFAVMQGRVAAGVSGIQAYGTAVNATLSGNATEAGLTSRIMQAEFSAIEASAMQAAAAIDRAAAVEATAYADVMAASKAATDAQVEGAAAAATAANLAARESAAAAAITSGAAADAAAAVDTAGVEAAVGWTAVLGPIAAVGIGIGLLVSMFHRSSSASKEATDAAKAYADALKSGDKSDFVDSITTQLSNNKIPETVAKLNQQFADSKVTSKEFVTAIQAQGKPLDDLRAKLQAVIKAGSVTGPGRGDVNMLYDKNGVTAAKKLLADLNSEIDGLSKATKKDLVETAAFAGVSSSIQKVAQTTSVATQSAQQYAAMAGIVVDKNGVAAVSAKTLATAVKNVSTAYGNASQSGSDFLAAVNTFSQSAGTAADRGALIGATLKSANGDALEFAGSMAGAATATSQLTDAFAQQREQLKQQSQQQAQASKDVTKAQGAREAAEARLTAAEARLRSVRGNPKSTAAQITSAEAAVTSAQNEAANSADSLTSAQQAAGQAGALAYRDTERAALKFSGTGSHMTAVINTAAKGAGDLVTQLEGIQSAAMAAASAMYQHEKDTKGAKQAADDAYKVYVTKTQGSLVDNAKKLGLTKDQAKALAKAYFGMPSHVKTLIEQEGANPVVDVLNRIGQLLANITGQQWKIPVTLDVSGLRAQIKADPSLGASVNKVGQIGIEGGGRYATGGLITGPGTRTSDDIPIWASKGEFMSTADSTSKNYDALQAGNKGAKLTVAGDSGGSNGAGKHVTIEKFEQNISYQGVGEPAARITPRGLRMAGYEMSKAI